MRIDRAAIPTILAIERSIVGFEWTHCPQALFVERAPSWEVARSGEGRGCGRLEAKTQEGRSGNGSDKRGAREGF